jgi:hypothetical protein
MSVFRVLTESSESALGMDDIGEESRSEIKGEVVYFFGEGLLDEFHEPVDHIVFQKDRDYSLLDGALLQ